MYTVWQVFWSIRKPKETWKSPQWGKPYECKQCGKCFSHAGSLRKHERVHTGEKPYECKRCGKCYSQEGTLRTHERVHTGEKPYECKRCGKCYSQAGTLRTHERVHTGEKPYECKRCGKCFSRAGYLRRHGRVHNCGYGSESLGSVMTAKHICCICEEEVDSEALLIQHYDYHMTHLG